MASLALSAAYRPLRVGFLVRPNAVGDVVKAATFNTVLWGGIANPILPIGPNRDLAGQLVRLFRVDVLHPVVEDAEVRAFFTEHSHLIWPDQAPGGSGLFAGDEHRRWLDVLDMTAWYRAGKWAGGLEPFRVIRWDDQMDVLAPLFACLFGTFPSPQYREAYIAGLGADEIVLPPALALPDAAASENTPLMATLTRLMPDSWSVWNEPGIYVGDPTQPADLIAFWNLRAAGAGLAFCPVLPIEVDRFMAYLTRHMDGCVKWARQDAARRRLSLWAAPGRPIAESVKALFPEDVASGFMQVGDLTWNGLIVRPAVYRLDPQNVLANLEMAADGPALDFHLPPVVDPNDVPAAHRSQLFVVSVQPLTESDYGGHTLRLPYLPDLNEWYSRETVLLPDRLRVGVREVGLIRRLYDQTARVTPIGFEAIVSRLLERAGIQSTPSRAGRVAQQMIAQIGGLEGCRVLKIRGVRKLINSGEAREGLTRGAATQKIHDVDAASGAASFNRYGPLHVGGTRLGNADAAFNYLLRREMLRPGLKVVCPKCTLEFWIGMPIDETCRCEYCGHRFLLAPLLRTRGDWQFRLSGLFGRKAGDEGGVPVALTLLTLLRILGATRTFVYTPAMDLKAPSFTCEVDLVVVAPGHDRETEIAMGECKGADEISDDDVRNITAAGRLLSQSGLRFYPVFAKTSDAFSPAEIARFRDLVKQDLEPVLFTAQELEPYHPYNESPHRAHLPQPHAHDLRDIARNSRALYLS
jgi:DNA-directed RNA polymerase subunit RPC12/RpoP